MNNLQETLLLLQNDALKVQSKLDKLYLLNSKLPSAIERGIDEYMCELESLCVRSRIHLDGYRQSTVLSDCYVPGKAISDVVGNIEVTQEGWLHIRLNTLLPSCKRKTNGYIGDTVSRLLKNYDGDLPYFERAFLAIVEYCNNKNHNALDNDNKGWKTIPNALKGALIPDDNQFILSLGLFSKLSDETRCEIYLMPHEDSDIFMKMYVNDMI